MYIKVHVVPESREEVWREKAPDSFEAAVRERARGGAANARMLALCKQHFSHAKRLYIVSGHHSPHKIVSIE